MHLVVTSSSAQTILEKYDLNFQNITECSRAWLSSGNSKFLVDTVNINDNKPAFKLYYNNRARDKNMQCNLSRMILLPKIDQPKECEVSIVSKDNVIHELYFRLTLFDQDENDDNPFVMSNPIPGASNLTASLNLASVGLKRDRISEVKKMIRNSALKIDTTALFAYDNLPLFLKSGEEHTYYYTVEIHHLAKGQYKFTYEPKAPENERPDFPNELAGYKKYTERIVSQPVYIDFITIK